MVHGDVFRPPKYTDLFVILIGTGIQLFAVSFVIIVFAMLGMLSPSYRGALVTSSLFLYVFMGFEILKYIFKRLIVKHVKNLFIFEDYLPVITAADYTEL